MNGELYERLDAKIVALRAELAAMTSRAKKAEARAERLAAYVRADDALFLTAIDKNASAAERLAMDKARRTAYDAVDAAGDLGGAS